MNANLKKAQAAAHTPEANAKRAASVARTLAAKKRAAKKAAKVTSIPLSAIPDDRPKKAKGKAATKPNSLVVDLLKVIELLARAGQR